MAVSFGKFVGASVFGILSDKYGRKNSFTLGAVFYTVGSLLTSFSPWYWPFLVGRMMIGSASSGLFYPALTICTFLNPHYGTESISTWTKVENSNIHDHEALDRILFKCFYKTVIVFYAQLPRFHNSTFPKCHAKMLLLCFGR